MTSRKFFCTFPQELISEPLISHTLGVKFDVVPNIRAATISESQAHVVVEIEGEAREAAATATPHCDPRFRLNKRVEI